MGRSRGQGGSGSGGGQQSKKECAAVGRSRRGGRTPYTDGRYKANKKRNLLTEARHATKKLNKLHGRGLAGKPGGMLQDSKRYVRLETHIKRLAEQAFNIR